ncbi:MAG: T9SS type A sorting domain-containing protein, partial [Melioribacteraceae bacterium]
ENISISYLQVDSTAKLNFLTGNLGTTNIKVTITDNGGNEFNNGNAKKEITFNIEVGALPQTGHVADYSSLNNWGLDFHNGQQEYELGEFYGKENVLKITLINKTSWTGTIYNLPELNLDEHRYVSYDIYFEGDDFGLGISGRTHCYFYDDGWDPAVNRNRTAAHAKRQATTADRWKTIFMDFRGKGGMDNKEGVEIDVKRIQKILLNYATSFIWPFPSDNGTVYIANLKIGDAVPDSLIPVIQPKCTINPIATQTLFRSTEARTIQLTGITSGNSQSIIPTLTVASNDTNFIPNPILSSVSEEGTATLTFIPANTTGKVLITLEVSANGSLNKSTSFYIDLVNEELSEAVDVELFRDSLYQTIRGFGTFYFPSRQNYLDIYTDDLGASAVRIGIIGNQIEPVNDNDNPNELNLDGFNYNAFDFNYLKKLKEKGVETFILTSWSPPAWMKKNLSVDYGFGSAPFYKGTDNKLEPYYFDEFAESMVAVVKMFQLKAGINLYAIGIQNEPAFNEPYASAILDPSTFAKLVGIVGKRFEDENITTKLYMPEQVFSQNHYSMQEYILELKRSRNSEKYVDIIATHGYASDGIQPGQPSYSGWKNLWNSTKSTHNPKELWMSETFPEGSSWDDALSLAGAIYGALKFGNISLWTLWDIEGSLMKNNSKRGSFFTSQNYYKFIRPGARRIKVESENEDILVTSFIDDKNKMLTTVMINKNDSPITVRILARTASVPATYDVYTSAHYLNFERTGNVGVNETLALPGKSVTTLVGKTDGEMVVDIQEEEQLPTEYVLYNNYPNPFNPTTTIKYSIKNSSDVKLFVYDILGREVKRLVNTQQNSGTYHINFNASEFASGVYFYRLQAGDFSTTKKLILLK